MTVQVVDWRTNSLSCCYSGICIVNKEKIVKLLLMASFDFFWCCDIDLKHSENKCRHLVDCFINMNNCAIMMRDFRFVPSSCKQLFTISVQVFGAIAFIR